MGRRAPRRRADGRDLHHRRLVLLPLHRHLLLDLELLRAPHLVMQLRQPHSSRVRVVRHSHPIKRAHGQYGRALDRSALVSGPVHYSGRCLRIRGRVDSATGCERRRVGTSMSIDARGGCRVRTIPPVGSTAPSCSRSCRRDTLFNTQQVFPLWAASAQGNTSYGTTHGQGTRVMPLTGRLLLLSTQPNLFRSQGLSRGDRSHPLTWGLWAGDPSQP